MARKKKPDRERKSHLVTARLNDIQYEHVCNAANDAGLSISDYLRHQAVFGKVENHIQIVADFKELEAITRELSAIGNNLNQLTRYFHMGGLRSASMMEELNRCLNSVMEMREKVMELGGDFHGYIKTHSK